jgi:MinD superfamily P-loop ATPase
MAIVQATNTQARVVPRVMDEYCLECPKCVARQVCRTKALLQIDPGEAPMVDGSICYGCHKCVAACPVGAIVIDG